MGAGRVYTTQLISQGGESAPRTISERLRSPYVRPSQREIAAAPGGRHLALLDGGRVIVRDRRGDERTIERVYDNDFRFSPDGRSLAFLRRAEGPCCHQELGVLDLDSGEQKVLDTFERARWLEWTRGGVVVLSSNGSQDELSLVSPDGRSRRLYAGQTIYRFAAASRGSRVVFFDAEGVHEIDSSDRAPSPKTLRHLTVAVQNAELSPSGEELAYIVPGDGVYLRRNGWLERLSSAGGVHSIWFSPGGATLLFSGPREAVAVDLRSGLRSRFRDEDGSIRTVRFRKDGPEVVISAGRRVLFWDPATGERGAVYEAAETERVEAAESFGDALAVWASRSERSPFFQSGPQPQQLRKKQKLANPFAAN